VSAQASSPRASRRPIPAPWTVPTRWIVALALALALARLVGLGRYGLWIDEAFSLHDALALRIERLTNFPLALAVLRAWLEFTGLPVDEAWLRFPAAACGAASVPLTAWAFRPLLGSRQAWIAAALLGASSWHWFWSQSARGYTLMLVLALLGAGVCVRALVQARPAWFFAGLVVAGAGALAHPTGGLVPAALLLAAPITRRRCGAPEWAPSLWVAVALAALGAWALNDWFHDVWGDYSWRKSGSSVAHFVLSTGFYVGAPVGLAALVGGVGALRSRDGARTLVLGVAVLGAILPLAAASLVKVSAQYVFVLAPWIAALAARALDDELAPRWRARTLGAFVLVWAAVDVGAYLTVRHGDRPRWRDAYQYVARARGAQDVVLGMAAPTGSYYLDPSQWRVREYGALVPLTQYDVDELRYWSTRERPMWLVLNREDLQDWPRDERQRVEAFLRDQCELRRVFTVRGTPRNLDVEVYLRP